MQGVARLDLGTTLLMQWGITGIRCRDTTCNSDGWVATVSEHGAVLLWKGSSRSPVDMHIAPIQIGHFGRICMQGHMIVMALGNCSLYVWDTDTQQVVR